MIKRIAAAAVLAGAALTMTATVASAAPMPHTPTSNAGETVAPPNMEVPDKPPTSISPDGTKQLEKLNQLGQITQVTKAADPLLGLLSPVTGLVPA
ncbi:hypothetical protein AB0H17_29150 [Streptomyces olivoreticuli]